MPSLGRALLGVAIIALALVLATLAAMRSWLSRRVTRPAVRLALVASAVAQGDLTRDVESGHGTSEVEHLGVSLSGMIGALRRLVGAIRSAADEAASMASQISASTEQMAPSRHDMSHTTHTPPRPAQQHPPLAK